MHSKAPLVLICNDDGIHAPGLHVLAKAVGTFADVYMVAPHRERSGFSHCLTISQPLRVQQLEAKPYAAHVYEVDGTPVDCVKIALDKILPRRPDWVLSGINRGGNLGTDTLYSGTVGAAMEGVINGCRAMAFSCFKPGGSQKELNYEAAGKMASLLFANWEKLPWQNGTMWNINVPTGPYQALKGVRIASLGKRLYDDSYWRKEDPRGLPYYWLGPDSYRSELISGSDCTLIHEGYATISPLKPSLLCEDSSKIFADILPAFFEKSF